jgi:hypothetical protein
MDLKAVEQKTNRGGDREVEEQRQEAEDGSERAERRNGRAAARRA